MAGAPFFFGDGDSDGVGLGVSVASGVTLGLGEGEADSVGEGDGVGELLRFFFFEEGLGEISGDGLGLGEDFFFFGEGEALGSSFEVAVGLGVVCFLGEGDFSGDTVGLGDGDLVAAAFFFLRGAGVGVGAKIFFSLLPNDTSAGARSATAVDKTPKISAPQIVLIRRIGAGT